MNGNPLDTLLEAGLITEIDAAFAKLTIRLSGAEGERATRLSLLASMLSRSCTADKSVRLDLATLSPENVAKLFVIEDLPSYDDEAMAVKEAISLFSGISERDWLDTLKAAPSVAAPCGNIQPLRPIVYDEEAGSVYLLRLWFAEQRVCDSVLRRKKSEVEVSSAASELIEKLFPLYGAPVSGEKDLQKEAALAVASQSLAIITGGPGTGKTSSVAAALCALIAENPGIRIGLCAPTGKAAAQLLSSISSQKELFRAKGLDEGIISRLPASSHTVHRLLQWSPARERYMRDAEKPLDLDALVIDEASMLSLSQADSLLSATPLETKLILLGDKDQLASVESGSVFADLCAKLDEREDAPFVLHPNVAELKKIHRFKEGGPIAKLKDAINAQEPEEAWKLLSAGGPDINLLRIMPSTKHRMHEFLHASLKGIFDTEPFRGYLDESDPAKAFNLFDSLRILCANRRGVFGVDSINGIMLELAFGQRAAMAANGLAGLPVIITRNNYSVGLNNGDVGLVLPSNGANAAFFRSESRDAAQNDGFRSCPLPLLPEHETAFAMTVHKAQGSGFEHALAVLPPDPANPLLTKELLYTAVTRAKTKLTVLCSEESFKAAVTRRTERASGLARALHKA